MPCWTVATARALADAAAFVAAIVTCPTQILPGWRVRVLARAEIQTLVCHPGVSTAPSSVSSGLNAYNATAADAFLPYAVTVVGGHASADNPWAGAPQVRRPAVCSSPQPSPAPTPEPPRQEWLPAGPWLVVRGPVPPQSNAPVHCWCAASLRGHSTEITLRRSWRFDDKNAQMPPQAVPTW